MKKAFISDSVTGIIGNVDETGYCPERGCNFAVIGGQRFYYEYLLYL